MATTFLPRNPSNPYASSYLSRPRTLRKISIVSHTPHTHTPSVSTSKCDTDGRSPNSILSKYEQELQQRIHAVQDIHRTWYNVIAGGAQERHLLNQERIEHAKHERDRRAEVERQEHKRQERSQLEAHRRRLAEAAERRRLEEERLQRQRHEAQAARLAQIEAEEEQRRRQVEQAERIRRERLRECIVCFDSQDVDMMVQVACSHWYCREHLRDAFEIAWTSRSPFQCCQQVISPDSLSHVFPQSFQAQYSLWLLERTTRNPVYCSNRGCSVFLPPSQGGGRDEIQCLRCGTSTCRHCQNAFHPQRECAADVDTQQARALAARQGWKACPSCENMVERWSGCLHMTCRCGTEFCYRCGQRYNICRGSCPS